VPCLTRLGGANQQEAKRPMKRITIVGGGLAGLALGVSLRQRSVPVTLWEAKGYPRHRVCGEFISGKGQGVLERLGWREILREAGAVRARTAAFFVGGASSPVRALAQPALCLSRWTLDNLLAQYFAQLGGELHENARWRGDEDGEGLVLASGRRSRPLEEGWRWFGLKIHARNVPLMADLEMHAGQDGYVGCTRLLDGEVNVCGLFRRRGEWPEGAKSWRELLCGQPGTRLHERLGGAALDQSSFCSISGLSLRAQRAAGRPQCCIGDALTMVPPVTGNGMSMALEAAELATEPLGAYSRGALSWAQAQQKVASACDLAFARRLAWARWLQWMMFAPMLRGGLGVAALRSDWLWRMMFSRTR